MLRHCNTNHYLASDKVVEKNDFGSEYETMTHSFECQNKTQNLALEGIGNLTTDVPARWQQDHNVWTFETAPDPSYNQPIDQLTKFNIGELLQDIQKFIQERASVDAVKKVFMEMDSGNKKLVDVDDFRWGLIDLGYNLSKSEAAEVVKHYDRNGDGMLSYEEFISKL